MKAARRCGDCTLCCTLLGVEDLSPPKPPAVKCAHVCSRGCRVYASRPRTCREFVCLWAQGAFPKRARPDRVGIVFHTHEGDELERLIGFYDPARPNDWRVLIEGLTRTSALGALIVIGPAGEQPLFMFKDGQMRDRPPDLEAPEMELT
ncbi:MAG TPA: hypothetical protein VGG29_20825 [Caulobacteraceae bacterium]